MQIGQNCVNIFISSSFKPKSCSFQAFASLLQAELFPMGWIFPLNRSMGSGVTEQLGALSNLAVHGPLDAAGRSARFYQISIIKAVFLLAKSWRTQHIKCSITGVYGSVIYKSHACTRNILGMVAEQSALHFGYPIGKSF